MSGGELYRIVSLWVNTGILSSEDETTLKAEYLRQLGTTTCTSCPNWKQDMFMHFRAYLRTINHGIMSANQYTLAPGTGSIYVAGIGNVVAPHNAAPGNIPLTDEIAADLLKRDKGYAEHIVKDPDYKKKEEPAAKPVAAKPATVEAAPVVTPVSEAK